MNVTDALRLGLRAVRRDPAAVLPFSLAGSAAASVARTVPLVGLVVAYALLAHSGRIAAFKRQMSRLSLDVQNAEPGTFAQQDVAARAADAVQTLVTPGVLAVLAASLLLAVLVYVVASGFAAAAEIHAVTHFLVGADGRHALAGGVRGVRESGLTLAGLTAALAALYLAPYLAAAAVAGPLALAGAGSLAVVVVALALPLAALWDLGVYVVFQFAPQAVVVDGVGVTASLAHSARFLRAHPARVLGFVALSVAAAIVVGAVAVGASFLSVTRVAAVVSLLGVAPVLAVVKTALYQDPAVRELPDRPGLPADLRTALGGGLRAVGGFVSDRIGLTALALGLVALGAAAGYWAATGLTIVTGDPPADYAAVFGPFPLDVFVDIAANNWTVAIHAAFSGLAFGVPAAAGLLFNGLLVGLVAHIGYPPRLAAALLAPHGVIEIPSLAVAGALGLDLGAAAWQWARGRTDDHALADHLVRALRVLAGLLPLFLLAAFIEAFVTPWIAVLYG